jgi:hypothetical protein
MNAAKSLIAFLFVAAASLAPAAQATVIDFNNLAGNYLNYIPANTSYTNSGFRFVGASYDYMIGAAYSGSDSSPIAYNGTDYFIAYSDFTISSATAAPFKVNSLDLVHWHDQQGVTQATLTGHKVGGGTVTQVVNVETMVNRTRVTGNDFTTFALSGFENLSSLTITHNGTYYLAMDNLVVNAASVPEPSSLALLGLAVAGFAFMRRRAGKAG